VAETPREHVGRWFGRVAAGSEDAHAAFVAWLGSAEGRDLLQRTNLTGYAIYQRGSELDVVFKTRRASILAGFLRNRRLWPAYWEFDHPGEAEAEAGREPIFAWAPPTPTDVP
jgi:hypothetical protein